MREDKDCRIVRPDLNSKFMITDGYGHYIEGGFDNIDDALKCAGEMIDEIDAKTNFDVVKKPSHYNSGKYEVIDIIESVLMSLKVSQFQAYCLGNSIKYICRAGLKGDFTEDIRKAIMYLQWAIGEDPRK